MLNNLLFSPDMTPKSDALPKNWPPNLPYLTTPSYSPSITPEYLSNLRARPNNAISIPPNTPKGPSPLVKITSITAPSHPANGQHGLFAAKDLKPGTFILQYLGEIHISLPPTSETSQSSTAIDPHTNSNYDLSLDREMRIGIDADKRGNEARFINDYRGIAERPNAEFREVWDERRKERGMSVWVLPEGKSKQGKGIKKGDEILVSYGRGFWGARKEEDG
jgi:hypothetical protein